MNKDIRNKFTEQPDFDVLSEDPYKTCIILKERLNDANIDNVSIVKREALGEIIATHYEVKVGKDNIAIVYEPLSCHSYNVITVGKSKVKVATIDTMLSFYLAFVYANRPYYDANRILCMSTFLFYVQQKNRLNQKGLLRRFSISCMGNQHSLEEIRGEKASKYKELMNNRNSIDYEMWFLKYRPGDDKTKTNTKANKPKAKQTKKTKKIDKSTRKNKK